MISQRAFFSIIYPLFIGTNVLTDFAALLKAAKTPYKSFAYLFKKFFRVDAFYHKDVPLRQRTYVCHTQKFIVSALVADYLTEVHF